MVKKKEITEIKIFLASPGDVSEERDIVERVVGEEYRNHLERDDIILKLVRWENSTSPMIDGKDGQQVINEQLVLKEFETYDLFVGIMWMRFGHETPRAGSGTVEEFNLALKSNEKNNKPHIMLYFNNIGPQSTPGIEKLQQMIRVQEFKSRIQESGLTWDYSGKDHFEKEFRRHLNGFLRDNFTKKEKTTSPSIAKRKQPLRIPPEYAKWLEDECLSMNIDKLITKGEAVQVGLPAVYIPLMTDDFQKIEKRGKRSS